MKTTRRRKKTVYKKIMYPKPFKCNTNQCDFPSLFHIHTGLAWFRSKSTNDILLIFFRNYFKRLCWRFPFFVKCYLLFIVAQISQKQQHKIKRILHSGTCFLFPNPKKGRRAHHPALPLDHVPIISKRNKLLVPHTLR